MTFDGRQPLMEDKFWWTTIIDERQFSMVDILQCKTTFRRSKTELLNWRLPKLVFGTKYWACSNSRLRTTSWSWDVHSSAKLKLPFSYSARLWLVLGLSVAIKELICFEIDYLSCIITIIHFHTLSYLCKFITLSRENAFSVLELILCIHDLQILSLPCGYLIIRVTSN